VVCIYRLIVSGSSMQIERFGVCCLRVGDYRPPFSTFPLPSASPSLRASWSPVLLWRGCGGRLGMQDL
jgi:hypothetical protein